MSGELIHQLKKAGSQGKEAARELEIALRRMRRGKTASVSSQTQKLVKRALRRSGEFAAPSQDFRVSGLVA